MPVESAGFDSPNLASLAEAFSSLASRIAGDLAPANTTIASDAMSAIVDLYGAKLAQFWQIASNAEQSGEAARVTVSTDDYRVLGYEYGTRAHDIQASGRALRFEWQGGINFFPYVQHPGNKPHLKGPQLEERLTMSAGAQWRIQLGEILDSAFPQ